MYRPLVPGASLRKSLVVLLFFFSAASVRGQGGDLKVIEENETEIQSPLKSPISSVAFSPDGNTVAVANFDVHLFDVSGSKPEKRASLKTDVPFGVRAMQFSPNGKFLVIAGRDRSVHIWGVVGDAPQEISAVKAHTGKVEAVAFSADGKLLATGGDDTATILWEVSEEGKLTQLFSVLNSKSKNLFRAPVHALAFNPRLKQLIGVDAHGDIRFFDVTGKKLTLNHGTKFADLFFEKSPLAVSPDGKNIAVGAKQFILTASGKTLRGHTEKVTGLSYTPSGASLASCGADGKIIVWNSQTTRIRFERASGQKFTCIACPPPGPDAKELKQTLIVAGADRGEVLFLKLGVAEK